MSVANEMAKCAVGVGVFGAVPVAAMLVSDEAERHRCGIGCVLEKNEQGVVYVQSIIPGGAAATSKADSTLSEGDIIMKVDDHLIIPSTSIHEVSSYIRGTEGTTVSLTIMQRNRVIPTCIKIMRRRLPGSKAEMLGALWQLAGPKKVAKPSTHRDQTDKLRDLYERGILSESEYRTALRRLCSEADVIAHAKDDQNFDGNRTNLPQAQDSNKSLPSASNARFPDLDADQYRLSNPQQRSSRAMTTATAVAAALNHDLQIFLGVHRSQAARMASNRNGLSGVGVSATFAKDKPSENNSEQTKNLQGKSSTPTTARTVTNAENAVMPTNGRFTL